MEWKPSEDDGGLPLKNYLIEMRPTSRSTWSKAGSVGPEVTKFVADKLQEGTEYLFCVTAVNDEGQSVPLEGKDTAKPQKKIGKLMFL